MSSNLEFFVLYIVITNELKTINEITDHTLEIEIISVSQI